MPWLKLGRLSCFSWYWVTAGLAVFVSVLAKRDRCLCRQDSGEMMARLDADDPGALVGTVGQNVARRRSDRKRGLLVRPKWSFRRMGEWVRDGVGGEAVRPQCAR